MKEGTPIHEHLSIFNKIISDLLNLDVKLEDEDKALLLLTSLPPSYEHLVTTMIYGKETLDLEEVTGTLISNEIRRRPSPGTDTGEGLMVNTSKFSGRSKDRKNDHRSRSKSRSMKDITCYNCGKKGHYKNQCNEPKKNKKGKRGRISRIT